MRAKKSLGQHFLMHPRIAERIVHAAALPEGATVLEIGPGTGMLTRPLLLATKKVVAVETDAGLVANLRITFAKEIARGALVLIPGDIRKFDIPNSLAGAPYHIVANIPYYLTGDIIRTFLSSGNPPRSMTLLVQKEVAVRIARDKKESILSIAVKTYGIPHYLFTVPKGAFMPPPSVDSAVLSITDIRRPFTSTSDERRFFEVVKLGFAHKRKLLRGNLAGLASKDDVARALIEAKIPAKARAEDVGLSSWNILAKFLA